MFLVIDLKNGYYHIPIREQDCHKSTVISPWYKMQFKRMAQSLSGALFTCSEDIAFVINDIEEFCDDLLKSLIVFINSLSEQLNHLDIVFKELSEFKLHLTQNTNFFKIQLNFWGMAIHQKVYSHQQKR